MGAPVGCRQVRKFAFGDNCYGQLGNTINNGSGNPNATRTLVGLPARRSIRSSDVASRRRGTEGYRPRSRCESPALCDQGRADRLACGPWRDPQPVRAAPEVRRVPRPGDQFQAKQAVLVVMPSGYGIQGVPRASQIAAASLRKPAGRQTNDLARAAGSRSPNWRRSSTSRTRPLLGGSGVSTFRTAPATRATRGRPTASRSTPRLANVAGASGPAG
jgi:hypothetical protein